MKRLLLCLFLLTPMFAWGSTADLKTGSTSTMQVPLYNPAEGATSNPDAYGRYTLEDILRNNTEEAPTDGGLYARKNAGWFSLGTAALLNAGTSIGDIPQLQDDGTGAAALRVDQSNLSAITDYLVNGTPILSVNQWDAILNATAPTASNPMATQADVAAGVNALQEQINTLSSGSLPQVSSGAPTAGACNWNTTDYKIRCRDAAGNVYASAAFTLDTAGDAVPDAFSFTDITGATTNTLYTSNAITVAGIDTPSPISVTGGAYEINSSGSWLTTSSNVSNGDAVKVRQTSSTLASTATDATVTIGGVSDTYTVTTASAGGSSYLVDEEFEGTGVPTGWYTVAGSPDYDYTTAPLEGTKSLTFPTTTARAGVNFDSTPQTDIWVGMRYYWPTLPGITSVAIRVMNVGASANLAEVGFRTDGRAQVTVSGGTPDYGDPAYVATAGVMGYIKVHYVVGSGSNTSCSVYLSTDGTTWNLASQTTDGTSTASVGEIQFKTDYLGLVDDTVVVSASDFNY